MSGWLSYLTGSGGAKSKDSTREAIVNLREHLLMLDKKEEYLGKKIDDEVRKARANATSNPRGTCRRLCPRLHLYRLSRSPDPDIGPSLPDGPRRTLADCVMTHSGQAGAAAEEAV